MKMRPNAIISFERILFAALAIDLVNNLAHWSLLSELIARSGMGSSPLLVLLLSLLSPLVGLVFWYFVARRGSNIAKWIITLFVAASVVSFARTMSNGVEERGMLMLAVAAISEVLKVIAVTRLFTAGARQWFARKGGEGAHQSA